MIIFSNQKLQDSFNYINCSSLGFLLNNDIRVDFAVFLERGSDIFVALNEYNKDNGNILSEINLIASSTVDTRLCTLFKQTIYFHRPLSSAYCLDLGAESSVLPVAGPEAANAAFDVAITLGFDNIKLFGYDFAAPSRKYTRSQVG